jgi:CRISPR-associated protein Csx3
MTNLTIEGLAGQIGKEKEERSLPNGVKVQQLCWRGFDLPSVDEILRSLSATPGHYVVDGPAPAWLVTAVAHGLHPQAVSLMDPRLGPVGVVGRKPSTSHEGEGNNLKFVVKEGEKFSLVEYEIVGGVFDVEDLQTVRGPKVDPTKGVVISGRGPNWLTVSLMMGYHATRWVAGWQPGQGACICMTHHPSAPLGDIVPEEDVVAARQ